MYLRKRQIYTHIVFHSAPVKLLEQDILYLYIHTLTYTHTYIQDYGFKIDSLLTTMHHGEDGNLSLGMEMIGIKAQCIKDEFFL